MREIYPDWVEDYRENSVQVGRLKEALVEESGIVGCVSHYFTLKNLTARRHNKYGEPRDGVELDNCEFIYHIVNG